MTYRLTNEVQAWKKYGAYLSGVADISRSNPSATFAQFLNACDGQTCGWSVEALKNAWNSGR